MPKRAPKSEMPTDGSKDHDHELSPRLGRKDNGKQFFSVPQGGKKLPEGKGGPSPGGVRLVGRMCFFMVRR